MNIEPLADERRILQQLKRGDEAAFNIVYGHYHRFIYEKVKRMLHSDSLAEDVTQEIFIKIWESRMNVADVRSLSSYIIVVARNHTINVIKAAARSEQCMAYITRNFESVVNNTHEEIQSREYLRFIQQQLKELPTRSREIFLMCREQSQSYESVATALGITREAVKSRMVHAMKLLSKAADKEIGLGVILLLSLF